MGFSHLPCTHWNYDSWSCCSCLENQTMRFKSNKTDASPIVTAAQSKKKEDEVPVSKNSSVFNSNSTWPSFQIPIKKQWHRRQAFMDSNNSSTDKENPFLAALENAKNEPLSSCLKDIDKTATDAFSGCRFLVPPFPSQTMASFRPKPKGLVDGLSRFFTPTNKRKSRVAISSLGDSLTLDGDMNVNSSAGNSFSGKPLCDPTPLKKVCEFDSRLPVFSDLLPSNNSPSTVHKTLGLNSVSTPLFSSSKPAGSGQLRNLFDGLSHLYTASTDSRKRLPSGKPLLKQSNCADKGTDSTLLYEPKPEVDSRERLADSDIGSPVSSSLSQSTSQTSQSDLLEAPTTSVPEKNSGYTSDADVTESISKFDNGEKDQGSPFEITEEDKLLFKKVQELSEKVLERSTDSSKPSLLHFGKYEIAVLCSSPFPKDYMKLSKIFLCEFCLKFMKSRKTLDRHVMKCTLRNPPADEIYRKDDLSIFEVDGAVSKTYCQNLCLLAKMFLDQKTLLYDVESFLFYTLTKNDRKGCHLIGYFSKERFCQQRYNASCVLVLPQHRRKGYGRFLIEFSYLLSKKEGRFCTPEKPLSDAGRTCYTSFWETAVLEHLSKVNREKKITIKSICKATGMIFTDVVTTLSSLELVKRNEAGKIVVDIDEKLLSAHLAQINQKNASSIDIDEKCLVWEPLLNSKFTNCKKCRKEMTKLREKRKSAGNSERMSLGGIFYSKEKIKCETCLLSQERERRRLLKHRNKRKHLELDAILAEPKKKRLKVVQNALMDSSDDSIEYLRYTTAKIRNLKKKLLKKHKLKLQKKYQEQKQETDILKYAMLGESSKIKVHEFLRKSSKLNIDCQKKLKHKHLKKDRSKKFRKKSKVSSLEVMKDRKKHKVKMKKKEKSLEKDESVTTPPVLLPAILSHEDSSNSSSSENDLSPPSLIDSSAMESKAEVALEVVVEEALEDLAEQNQIICEDEVLENEKEECIKSNPEESVTVEELPKPDEENEIVINLDSTGETQNIQDDMPCDANKSLEIIESVDISDTNYTIITSSIVKDPTIEAAIEPMEKDFSDNSKLMLDEPVIIEKDDDLSENMVVESIESSHNMPLDECSQIEDSKDMESNAVEIIFSSEKVSMDTECVQEATTVHHELELTSPRNELKSEEENEVREAVEIINEQMEQSSSIDMPLTPQTPESDHSRSYQHLSPYQSQSQECDGSVEEIDDTNNMDCQELEKSSVTKMHDDIQECHFSKQNKDDSRIPSNDTYTPEIIEQPDIIVEMPQVSQPVSQLSNPSTPIGTIVSKHTPTPQEMSSMGVYTPDSSTNSGYNSVEIDVCQLGLESPASVCSSEITQNSVEARSSTPQSYPDCAQLNPVPPPYCINASMSETCSNSNRREMIAAAAAAQAAVVQAQAQAHHTSHSGGHCVSNRKRQQQQQHSVSVSQRLANIPPSGPVSSLMQSSMVSVNATAVNALFVGPAPNTNNGYMNAMNMSVPCSNATAAAGPVTGSYMVGVPVATVIQPQSAAAFAAASMQNHHQLQQSPQNFSVANHPSGSISGAMQRLTHVGVSPSIASNTCPVSSVTPNFHIQSPSYTYTPTPTPTPNTPSQIGTSCSLAKLQQLTNGIMDIVPNPPCNTMTPPPNMTPPSPQVSITPPPQMQRSLTPAMTGLQPQIPMQSSSHGYGKYHFHHRQMQRNTNVALSPNLVASYQTINGVGYRIQQAPSAMLNTGYTTFINQAQLPPSAAVQMGMVNVNMHGQTPYQETNRPQNTMYTTYSYHISGNLQPQSLNPVMRR